MGKNGLTILKTMVEEDFSTYLVREIRNPVDDIGYDNAKYGFEINTNDMYISFQHCGGLIINVSVFFKNPHKKQFSYRIMNRSYQRTEELLHGVRDIIHDLTYEALDRDKLVAAFVEYFKNNKY